MSPWRQKARAVILAALDEARDLGLDARAARRLVDARYPFGPRKRWPYKVWLDERRRLVTFRRRRGAPVDPPPGWLPGQLWLRFPAFSDQRSAVSGQPERNEDPSPRLAES
jgi:hypothetical protein